MTRLDRYMKGLRRTARVLEREPLSAAKLAKRLGLSRMAAYERIKDLRELGCVFEETTGESTRKGGERPKVLRILRTPAVLLDPAKA